MFSFQDGDKKSNRWLNQVSPGFQSASSLIDAFEDKQSVYFSTKQYGLIARAPFAKLLNEGKPLSERVDASLKFAKSVGYDNAIAIGAIPFDVDQQNQVCVASNVVQHYYNKNSFENLELTSMPMGVKSVDHIPSKDIFRKSVADATREFKRSALEKVVLSRSVQLETENKIDLRKLITNLVHKNRNGFNFAVSLPSTFGSHSTFVGASPELLLRKEGNFVYLNPLAGSIPIHKDWATDHRQSQELLESEKDLREHALVVQSIREILNPLCHSLNIPERPSLTRTDTMWHLSSKIQGELKNPYTSSLDLALKIHPTPAVSGYPRPLACSAIESLESYERDLYTGMVGWSNIKGDGEWAVAIRCASIAEKEATIYAGAGIVAGSCPDKEYVETHAKLQTMARALGVEIYEAEDVSDECCIS